MKRILIILLIEILATTTVCSLIVTSHHKKYVEVAEKLLKDLEVMCEDNNLPWGDTICEGDSWLDYVDVCKKIKIEK